MYVPCACLMHLEPEEGVRFLVTPGVVDSCEQSCGFWEWSMGPLEEDQVFIATGVGSPTPIFYLSLILFPDLVGHCVPVAYFPGLMPDEVILLVLALCSRRAWTMESTLGCLGHSLSLVLEREL